MKSKLSLIAVASLAGLLTACGGGGGGEEDTGTAPTIPSTDTVQLQTTSTPATYSTPGLAAAFDYLNRERLNCGFGALNQNAQLDQAAKNHALYVSSRNNMGDPHIETEGSNLFTGVTSTDRAKALGYPASNGEVFEVGNLPWIEGDTKFGGQIYNMDGYPAHAIKTILAAPYHAMGALASSIDAGMAFEGRNEVSGTYQTTIMSFFAVFGKGTTLGGQEPSTPTVRTFPCDGSTGMQPALFSEWIPTGPLFANRNTSIDPVGHPIYIFGESNTTLSIDRATITRVSTGENVPVYETRTKGTDVVHQSNYRDSWVGFIFPDKPFVPLQQYRVHVEGRNDSRPFVRDFTFTAGQYSVYDLPLATSLGLPIQ